MLSSAQAFGHYCLVSLACTSPQSAYSPLSSSTDQPQLAYCSTTIRATEANLTSLKQKISSQNPYMGTMSSFPSPSPSPLLSLPAELLAAIFANLSREDLYVVNLTSKFCRQLAAPLIWKQVDLVDCRAVTSPVTGQRIVSYGPGSASHSGRGIPAGASVSGDEHDDMPIIKKLWVLATYVDLLFLLLELASCFD